MQISLESDESKGLCSANVPSAFIRHYTVVSCELHTMVAAYDHCKAVLGYHPDHFLVYISE